MESLEKYADDLNQIELFPDGKRFRLTFDPTVGKMRLLARKADDLEEIRDEFRVDNNAAFFAQAYGYRAEHYLYAVNKFGYFSAGMAFEVFNCIKTIYGSLSCIAISKNCLGYLDTYLRPLKATLSAVDKSAFVVPNVAEDSGRNNELRNMAAKLAAEGKADQAAKCRPYEFRDYQVNAIKYLLFSGYGRGVIEIPTGGGKSFILANFIWTMHKMFDRNCKYLILVPNKQLVEQFYSDLVDYGYAPSSVTKFTAGLKRTEKFNHEAQIIIANRQYVFNHKDELPKVGCLICDECH